MGDVDWRDGYVAEPTEAAPWTEPKEDTEGELVRCRRRHSSGCPVINDKCSENAIDVNQES